MSERTKMRHINSNAKNDVSIMYVICDHKTYAIPKKVAEKYIIDKEINDSDSVPADVVFAKLEKKLTKAGALLKGLRTRENLTQIEFAKKIKVTQANLSHMENGRRPIGKTIAKRIEQVFGVDYRYFLS